MSSDKYVDEGWKESVQEEKERSQGTGAQHNDAPHPSDDRSSLHAREAPQDHVPDEDDSGFNFMNYITSLALQTMVFLGEIPHPVTNQNERNIQQAKFIIDTLRILKEKTQGNLTAQEDRMLQEAIYELQMKYIEEAKKDGVS